MGGCIGFIKRCVFGNQAAVLVPSPSTISEIKDYPTTKSTSDLTYMHTPTPKVRLLDVLLIPTPVSPVLHKYLAADAHCSCIVYGTGQNS